MLFIAFQELLKDRQILDIRIAQTLVQESLHFLDSNISYEETRRFLDFNYAPMEVYEVLKRSLHHPLFALV
jgi:hypothetical protein